MALASYLKLAGEAKWFVRVCTARWLNSFFCRTENSMRQGCVLPCPLHQNRDY